MNTGDFFNRCFTCFTTLNLYSCMKGELGDTHTVRPPKSSHCTFSVSAITIKREPIVSVDQKNGLIQASRKSKLPSKKETHREKKIMRKSECQNITAIHCKKNVVEMSVFKGNIFHLACCHYCMCTVKPVQLVAEQI